MENKNTNQKAGGNQMSNFSLGVKPYDMKEYIRRASSKKDNRFEAQCMECGRKFRTASYFPKCPKCGSYDIEEA
jgi:predicted Zn-ribbon and HTH transcriptional regulator